MPARDQGLQTVRVTRKFTFEAAHHLPGHEKCGRVHGHSYKLRVTFRGPVSSKTGMLIDFGAIKAIVQYAVIARVDHRDLNQFLSDLYSCHHTPPPPTAEELVDTFAMLLRMELRRLQGLKTSVCNEVELYSIRLWETENCCATWLAEENPDD